MRIKEERDSWNASNILKRDYKHSHEEPRQVYRTKKNTRRWCKGKVGREHVIIRIFKPWVGTYWRLTIQCKNCSKEWYNDAKFANVPIVNPEVIQEMSEVQSWSGTFYKLK